MADCPHCKVDLGKGFVDQETLTTRLKTKDDAIALLNTEVTALRPKAATHDALTNENVRLTDELSTVRQTAERRTALAGIGVTDDKTANAFNVLYAAEMDGKSDEDRVAFGEFDTWAKENPLLSGYLTGKPADPPVPGATPPPVKPNELPSAAGPVKTPPPQQGKMTAKQSTEYFQSKEYRALSPDEQKVKFNEKVAEANAQPDTPPA